MVKNVSSCAIWSEASSSEWLGKATGTPLLSPLRLLAPQGRTEDASLGGWVPSEQIFRQVQEVEEVREAHKAAAKCTNGSNYGNGTKCKAGGKKNSYWEGALASKKAVTCSRV
jgi:hypothetical protein